MLFSCTITARLVNIVFRSIVVEILAVVMVFVDPWTEPRLVAATKPSKLSNNGCVFTTMLIDADELRTRYGLSSGVEARRRSGDSAEKPAQVHFTSSALDRAFYRSIPDTPIPLNAQV